MAHSFPIRDIEYFRKKFKAQEDKLLDEYFAFLRFPTISADPAKRPQLQACAKWLEQMLANAGFEVELWNREGAPIVFATQMDAGVTKPTLLIYNHYDVQPVDPLEEWVSDPFSPTKQGSQVTARGAADNKGQCFYVLSALLSLLSTDKAFPINIKYLIEGEEESGSVALSEIVEKKKEELKADYVLIVDLGMRSPLTPAITLGTRGLLACTIEVEGTKGDLHSGSHGGLAYNPLHALVEILAKARGPDGHITIPGFYEDVIAADASILAKMNLDYSEEDYKTQYGAYPTGGEKSFSPLERCWLRPTLEINGLSGGYRGPGGKTVIPSTASAKITCRIVPNQDPHKIGRLVKSYFENIAPKGTRVSVTCHEGKGAPVRTSIESPIVRCLEAACEQVFWQKCEYIFEGASIPIVPALQKASGGEVCMFGLGLDADKIHAPNESFGWDRIEKGFITICKLIEGLGKL